MTTIMFDERGGVRSSSETRAPTFTAGEAAVACTRVSVRQLDAGDLPAVESHLLGLGPSDRRARFLSYPADAAITSYVRGIDFSSTALVGAFDERGRMVGLVEAHPTGTPHTVEIAVSIDPALRRYGLGQRVVARALALASTRGMRSAEFVFAPSNGALARLVQALGGRVTAPGHALIDRSADVATRPV